MQAVLGLNGVTKNEFNDPAVQLEFKEGVGNAANSTAENIVINDYNPAPPGSKQNVLNVDFTILVPPSSTATSTDITAGLANTANVAAQLNSALTTVTVSDVSVKSVSVVTPESPSPSPEPASDDDDTGLIVGAAVGGSVGAFALIAACIYCSKNKRKSDVQPMKAVAATSSTTPIDPPVEAMAVFPEDGLKKP